jgi:large subunit ribosomal protein L35
MPNKKKKTHKGLAKRMKITASGKVLRHRAGRRHLLSHKSAKHRRRLRENGEVTGARAKTIREAIGS